MKFINDKILSILQTKFPKFGDLLLREQQIRKESVQAHGLPGMGKDVEPGLAPWKKLPNVRDFAITVKPYDWLLFLFGLKRRMPPRLEFWSWRNAPANKYINYMFKRLRKQVELGLYKEGYKTVWRLMNSTAYQAASFNFVSRNWHRNMSIGQVEMHLRKLRTLIKGRATKINYSRVYLDEPNKVRPLGVPTLEWRVYLHMFNNLVVQWRLVSEKNNQHGYLPGRGIITAWESLIPKLKRPNIFEADFKGFFDNVTHFGLRKMIYYSLKFPGEGFLITLCQSLVTLPPKIRIPEPHEEYLWLEQYTKGLNLNQNLLGHILKKNDRLNWAGKGVPQGAPISCSLATLALRKLEDRIECVLYADDGLYFPVSWDNYLAPLNDEEMGTEVKEGKTRILKVDGKWVVDSFKFLGIRYYPSKDLMLLEDVIILWLLLIGLDLLLSNFPIFTFLAVWITWRDWGMKSPEVFEADTRKGAKLRFTERESFISYLYVARDGFLKDEALLPSGSPGKNYFMNKPLSFWLEHNYGKWLKIRSPAKLLFNNGLTGWFLSRMQINSWNIEQKANFHLTKVEFSWVSICWPLYADRYGLNPKEISVFTASSFAVNDLMSIIKERPWRKGRKVRVRKPK